MPAPFPTWVEPMAATLTQERFTGPEWIFERKLDGIRLLAFKDGGDVRLLSRNQLPQNASYPSVVAAVARAAGARRHPRRRGDGRLGQARRGRLPRLRRPVAGRPRRDAAAARRAPRAADALPFDAAAAARRVASTIRALGARLPRRLGRRHRQAPRLALRAPALAALAEDEVRGVAGAGRRRLHRPAGRRVGLGALLVGYFDGDDFVFAGKVGTGFDTKLLLDLRARLDALEIAQPPFTRATACRACARTGCARRSSSRSRSSSGRRTASCAIRACSACASTRRAREVIAGDA